MSKKNMIIAGTIKMLSGILLMGFLLFFPAGTMNFPGAWRMLVIMFVPMLIMGAILFFKAPKLLEKRLSTNEGEKEQKLVILFAKLT